MSLYNCKSEGIGKTVLEWVWSDAETGYIPQVRNLCPLRKLNRYKNFTNILDTVYWKYHTQHSWKAGLLRMSKHRGEV